MCIRDSIVDVEASSEQGDDPAAPRVHRQSFNHRHHKGAPVSGAVGNESRWLTWVRALPRASVLVFCAIAMTAVQAVLGVLQARIGVRVTAALLVGVAAAASEIDKLHIRRGEQREAEQQARQTQEAAEAEWLRQAQDCLRVWPAPRIDEVDPYVLGVTRSPLADRYARAGERLPPYVGRDWDAVARERLRARGLVLLIGAPASGVTRTAYEVASGGPTTRVVLAPQAPNGLRNALHDLDILSRLEPPVRLVLWLGRVDAFADDGLTAAMLRRCRERSRGLWVVATISTTRYQTWETEQSDVAAEFGEPVTLERLPSAEELSKAEAAYPGVDFSEGVAAAFTAARALLVRMRAGDGDCPHEPAGSDCPVARAVVAVAISWAGTGTVRPLPMARLSELVRQRLNLSEQPDPRHLVTAVEWASAPTLQGAALLRHSAPESTGETVEAHREIAEICSAWQRPSRAVWAAALEEAAAAADSEAVGRIGFRAHSGGDADTAAQAWARIARPDEPAAAWLERGCRVQPQTPGGASRGATAAASARAVRGGVRPRPPRGRPDPPQPRDRVAQPGGAGQGPRAARAGTGDRGARVRPRPPRGRPDPQQPRDRVARPGGAGRGPRAVRAGAGDRGARVRPGPPHGRRDPQQPRDRVARPGGAGHGPRAVRAGAAHPPRPRPKRALICLHRHAQSSQCRPRPSCAERRSGRARSWRCAARCRLRSLNRT